MNMAMNYGIGGLSNQIIGHLLLHKLDYTDTGGKERSNISRNGGIKTH